MRVIVGYPAVKYSLSDIDNKGTAFKYEIYKFIPCSGQFPSVRELERNLKFSSDLAAPYVAVKMCVSRYKQKLFV